MADLLLKRGYRVVGISRSSWPSADARLDQISADLSKREDVERVIESIRQRHAKFDFLLYSAGALAAHEIDELDYETLEYLHRVNVFAPMIIESRLLDLISSNDADVVNVTSSSIVDFYPKFAEYSTSKVALAKFTSDVQHALKGSRARVTEVCPSGFTSTMYETMLGEHVDRDERLQIRVQDLAEFIASILNLPKRMEIGRVYINRK